MVDDTSVFDEKAYEDVMNRLKDVRITNKANTEDQLERVHAVTVIVQPKDNVILNPRNPCAWDILNRSTVIKLKDGPIHCTSAQRVKTIRSRIVAHSYSKA